MTIDRLRAHWGFTRMPFAKDLAPSMLHSHRSMPRPSPGWPGASTSKHWECSPVRSAPAKPSPCGLPWPASTPAVTPSSTWATPRRGAGLYSTIVSALGACPVPPGLAHPQAQDALATEEHERGRKVVLILDEAHMLDADQLEGLRLLTNSKWTTTHRSPTFFWGRERKPRKSHVCVLDVRHSVPIKPSRVLKRLCAGQKAHQRTRSRHANGSFPGQREGA